MVDQLHVFGARTTADIYQGDFVREPDYRKPGEHIDWWYHYVGSLTGAGVAEISNQMEYAAEGSIAPIVGVRGGDFKFVYCLHDPPQSFDLASDPNDMQNLANDPALADKMTHFTALMNARWDLERFDDDVSEALALRHIVHAALGQGALFSMGLSAAFIGV